MCAYVITLFIAVLVSSIELRKMSHLVCLTYGPLLFNRDPVRRSCITSPLLTFHWLLTMSASLLRNALSVRIDCSLFVRIMFLILLTSDTLRVTCFISHTYHCPYLMNLYWYS